MLSANPLIFLAAVLLLAGVLLSKTSSRLGVPSLLLFLGLGMLAGSEGLLGVEFEDFALAQRYGIIALAFILFSGGAGTAWRDVRRVLIPGVALATVGVLVSAIVLGALAAVILDLELLEGMLLGSIIASTDAAAVFSILRSRGVAIVPRLRHLLELESGSNDPAAVFLTVGMIGLIQGTTDGIGDLISVFVVQMGVGLVAGVVLARAAVALINRLHLEYDGLYPVLTVAFVLLTYEGTAWLGGSGFLATYVAGLTIANAEFLHKRSLLRFHDAIAWLMQISMFVLMGLLVFPLRLIPVAGQALLVAAVLTLIARPLAVLITLVPFRSSAREIAFVSWVGLRGATPIILATFPVVAGVHNADTIFHVVFFVVLLSVIAQGWHACIEPISAWSRVAAPNAATAEAAEAIVDAGRRAAGDLEVHGIVLSATDIASELARLDRDHPEILLCLTTRARRPLGRALLGSIAREVVRRSDQAIALVGPRCDVANTRDIRRLLVCLDGTAPGEVILPWAKRWSTATGVPLILVRVVYPLVDPAARIPPTETQLDELGYVRRLALELERDGYRVGDVTVQHPSAPDAITDLAANIPDALIAVSTAGAGLLSEALEGSTFARVVRTSSVPVIVARQP